MNNFERTDRSRPGSQRVFIRDLSKKLTYIPSLFNEARTLKALEKVSGVSYTTLAEALKRDDQTQLEVGMTNKTAENLQAGLRERGLEFALDWVEWRDPAGNGRDTFEAFREKLNEENRDFSPYAQKDPATKQRRHGLRLTSRHLAVEVPDQYTGLAGLELWFHQAGAEEPMPVSFILTCQPMPTTKPGFLFGVKRGRLEIDPGKASIPPGTKERLGGAGPATFSHDDPARELTVEIANPRGREKAWTIWSDHGPMGYFSLDDEHPLCRIAGLAPDDEVTAIFKVFVWDLEPLGLPDDGDDEDDDPDPYSFACADGKPLSPNKRQIIRQMLVKEEVGSPSDGWVIVASDGRVFEEDKADDA